MDVVTGSVGGIVRDLVGQEPSVVLRREITITAAVLGALTYVFATKLAQPWLPPAVIGFLVTFVVRGLAIHFNWTMPGYRRPA